MIDVAVERLLWFLGAHSTTTGCTLSVALDVLQTLILEEDLGCASPVSMGLLATILRKAIAQGGQSRILSIGRITPPLRSVEAVPLATFDGWIARWVPRSTSVPCEPPTGSLSDPAVQSIESSALRCTTLSSKEDQQLCNEVRLIPSSAWQQHVLRVGPSKESVSFLETFVQCGLVWGCTNALLRELMPEVGSRSRLLHLLVRQGAVEVFPAVHAADGRIIQVFLLTAANPMRVTPCSRSVLQRWIMQQRRQHSISSSSMAGNDNNNSSGSNSSSRIAVAPWVFLDATKCIDALQRGLSDKRILRNPSFAATMSAFPTGSSDCSDWLTHRFVLQAPEFLEFFQQHPTVSRSSLLHCLAKTPGVVARRKGYNFFFQLEGGGIRPSGEDEEEEGHRSSFSSPAAVKDESTTGPRLAVPSHVKEERAVPQSSMAENGSIRCAYSLFDSLPQLPLYQRIHECIERTQQPVQLAELAPAALCTRTLSFSPEASSVLFPASDGYSVRSAKVLEGKAFTHTISRSFGPDDSEDDTHLQQQPNDDEDLSSQWAVQQFLDAMHKQDGMLTWTEMVSLFDRKTLNRVVPRLRTARRIEVLQVRRRDGTVASGGSQKQIVVLDANRPRSEEELQALLQQRSARLKESTRGKRGREEDPTANVGVYRLKKKQRVALSLRDAEDGSLPQLHRDRSGTSPSLKRRPSPKKKPASSSSATTASRTAEESGKTDQPNAAPASSSSTPSSLPHADVKRDQFAYSETRIRFYYTMVRNGYAMDSTIRCWRLHLELCRLVHQQQQQQQAATNGSSSSPAHVLSSPSAASTERPTPSLLLSFLTLAQEVSFSTIAVVCGIPVGLLPESGVRWGLPLRHQPQSVLDCVDRASLMNGLLRTLDALHSHGVVSLQVPQSLSTNPEGVAHPTKSQPPTLKQLADAPALLRKLSLNEVMIDVQTSFTAPDGTHWPLLVPQQMQQSFLHVSQFWAQRDAESPHRPLSGLRREVVQSIYNRIGPYRDVTYAEVYAVYQALNAQNHCSVALLSVMLLQQRGCNFYEIPTASSSFLAEGAKRGAFARHRLRADPRSGKDRNKLLLNEAASTATPSKAAGLPALFRAIATLKEGATVFEKRVWTRVERLKTFYSPSVSVFLMERSDWYAVLRPLVRLLRRYRTQRSAEMAVATLIEPSCGMALTTSSAAEAVSTLDEEEEDDVEFSRDRRRRLMMLDRPEDRVELGASLLRSFLMSSSDHRNLQRFQEQVANTVGPEAMETATEEYAKAKRIVRVSQVITRPLARNPRHLDAPFPHDNLVSQPELVAAPHALVVRALRGGDTVDAAAVPFMARRTNNNNTTSSVGIPAMGSPLNSMEGEDDVEDDREAQQQQSHAALMDSGSPSQSTAAAEFDFPISWSRNVDPQFSSTSAEQQIPLFRHAASAPLHRREGVRAAWTSAKLQNTSEGLLAAYPLPPELLASSRTLSEASQALEQRLHAIIDPISPLRHIDGSVNGFVVAAELSRLRGLLLHGPGHTVHRLMARLVEDHELTQRAAVNVMEIAVALGLAVHRQSIAVVGRRLIGGGGGSGGSRVVRLRKRRRDDDDDHAPQQRQKEDPPAFQGKEEKGTAASSSGWSEEDSLSWRMGVDGNSHFALEGLIQLLSS